METGHVGGAWLSFVSTWLISAQDTRSVRDKESPVLYGCRAGEMGVELALGNVMISKKKKKKKKTLLLLLLLLLLFGVHTARNKSESVRTNDPPGVVLVLLARASHLPFRPYSVGLPVMSRGSR